LAFCAASANAQINWLNADVGNNVTYPGSVTTNGDGSLEILGGGDDIWNNSSDFHFYYAWASGTTWDASIQVENFTGPDFWSKVELMVCASDPTVGPQGSDAFIAAMNTQPTTNLSGGADNEFGVDQFRSVAGGASDWKQAGTSPIPAYPNVWMKLHRNGPIFSVIYSYDGVNWTNYIDIDTSKNNIIGQDNGTTFGIPFPDAVTVGIGVTAHGNNYTTLADATIAHLNVTFPPVQAPTVLNPVVQVQSTTAYIGGEASFSFATTNNANPPIVLPTYQWYKNSTLLPGATGISLTWLAAPSDAGATVYCKATIPPPYNTSVSSITSSTGTLTVNPGTVYTYGLKTELFTNETTGADVGNVEAGDSAPAAWIALRKDFDDPGGYGNNYVSRVSGYFIPPTTTNYVFFIASDDNSDLFLSPDTSATNKTLVAQETGWDPMDGWLGGGTGIPPQKRSDQWTNSVGVAPWASGIPLISGKYYYIEAVHWQGGGGDSLGVTFQTTDQISDPNWPTLFTNGTYSIMQASNQNIAYISRPDTTPTWTLEPTNTTVTQGNGAIFAAIATTGGEFGPYYQWYRGTNPIAGATFTTLYLPNVAASDNGAQFFSVATAPVSGLTSTSAVVSLSVASPVLEKGWTKVEYWYNGGGTGALAPVENGTAPAPDHIITSPKFESSSVGNTAGNNYVNRLTALFYPPANGNYTFFINSDDAGDLFVSSNATPAGLQMVAQETAWSNPWQWLGDLGTATPNAQKRSDSWSPDGGVTVPWAAGIPLVANQPYYVQIVHEDSGGGNNAEATFKLVNDLDPANGTASKMTGNLIAINVPRAFMMGFVQEPANVTVPSGGVATFTALGITDSRVAVGGTGDPRPLWTNYVVYQWTKNGTAIPGATGTSYSFGPVSPLDTGAQVVCQIRAMGYVDNSLNPIWSNSTPATVTISGNNVYEPGFALHEHWPLNPGRAAVENFTAGAPDWTMASPAFEVDINGTEVADNFTDALLGFFVPPTNGLYVFFCNSDDDSDLFLSTDSSASDLRLIAQETAWAGPLNWGASGGTVSQVRSDTFVDPTTGTTPYASGISLVSGKRYAMEMVHHQGGGGTVSAVTAKLITDPDPVAGSVSTIRGSEVGTYVPKCTFVTVTNQPQSETNNNYTSVSFTAGGATDSTVPIGPETDWRPYFNNFLEFQWYKNTAPVAGATASTFSMPEVLPSDNGAQIYCTMRGLGYADSLGNVLWATSQVATLTVITSTPALLYASIYTNANYTNFGELATNYIVLAFSQPMDPTLLSQMSTYTLGGGLTLLDIFVNSNDFRSVALAVSGPVTFPLNVTVSSLLSGLGGGPRVSNTSVAVDSVPLTDADIGIGGIDPAIPGMMFVEGPQAYTIYAEGSDIWGNADGFNFAYEMKTNNFDVVVRMKDNKHTSNWAKGGLMVRESLDAGSRDWNIINDPVSSDGIPAPDGSGLGANAVECNARNSTNGASGGWALNPNPVPDYPNAWVRLTRVGNLLSAYYSTNGISWTLQATQDPTTVGDSNALPAVVYVGLCVTAHNNDPVGTPLGQCKYLNIVDFDNYSSSYVPQAPTLTATHVGTNIVITWTPTSGMLLDSPALVGPGVNWQPVGAGGTVTLPATGSAMFFRVVVSP